MSVHLIIFLVFVIVYPLLLHQNMSLSGGFLHLLELLCILDTVRAGTCWRGSSTTAEHFLKLLDLICIHLASKFAQSVSEFFLQRCKLKLSNEDMVVCFLTLLLQVRYFMLIDSDGLCIEHGTPLEFTTRVLSLEFTHFDCFIIFLLIS